MVKGVRSSYNICKRRGEKLGMCCKLEILGKLGNLGNLGNLGILGIGGQRRSHPNFSYVTKSMQIIFFEHLSFLDAFLTECKFVYCAFFYRAMHS
jgi:hypothetical protein